MPEDEQKILISGASGLLGTALCRALALRHQPVTQLVRYTPLPPVEGRKTLLWDPAAHPTFVDTGGLEDAAAAIHLSGANVGAQRWTEKYRRELIESRVASTRALAEALAGLQKKPKALLVASAVGYYGNRDDELLDESSAPGSGFLAELCQQWEQATEPARQAGIRVAHLRLGVILAPRGGALQKMLPAFRLGLGGPLGHGHQWMSWISLEDALRGFLFVLDRPDLEGAMNLTAPQAATNAEFTRTLGHQLHRPTFFRAPAPLLRLAFGQMADETLLASTRATPAKLLTSGFTFLQSTLESALQASL
ncbi:TIGR01777 family oxidoreductase [Telmatobacter bradus]|uniref:TIGR01777 family oxidoreductase n=1 Tax=Telmatobacter bradus TaxID=474953 RepID=UPI003B427FD2